MTRLLILLAFVLHAQDAPPAAIGQWQPTGPLLNPRPSACIVSLSDGRVLVTGGSSPEGPLNSAEIYLPTEGIFVSFTSMDKPRAGHRCLLLAGDRVLLLGGESSDALTASVYVPETDTWTAIPDLGPNRSAFSATILDDTRILIAGGIASDNPLDTLLILDPVTLAASPLISTLAVSRSGHTATLLHDGRVIFTGGNSADGPTASVELFDPASSTFPLRLNMIAPRRDHSATLLHDGRLLITGGSDSVSDLASAEVFTPGEDTLTALNSRLATARRNHFALLVQQNGSVLLGGGSSASSPLDSTELFLPDSNAFTTVGALTAPRTNILAALLPDGRVLAIGGANANGPSLACGTLLAGNVISLNVASSDITIPTFMASDLIAASGKFPSISSGKLLSFTLSRTVNAVTTDLSSRLITRSLTLSDTADFGPTPLFSVTSKDLPGFFRLTASTTSSLGSISASRSFVTKFRTTFSASILPANPTITGQPARVAYRISSDSSSSIIPGLISANLGSLNASTSPNILGFGALEICCPSLAGPLEGKAIYAGTSTHALASSATFTHQVVPNLPTLSIRQPASGLRLLTPAILEAQVSAPAGVSSPLVTGSVRLGNQTLSLIPSGATSSAALTYSPTFDDRRNGNVCFAATYSGSAAYQALAPVNQCFSVAPAAPTLTMSTSDKRFAFGQSTPVTVTLSFNPQLGLASRIVALFRQPTSPPGASPAPIGLVNLTTSSPGIAAGTVSLLVSTSLTPDVIRADYAASGDLDSASTVLNATMLPISTRIAVVSPSAPALNPFSLRANLCTETPIPVPGLSGSVEFFDGTLSLGRVTIQQGTVIPICPASTSANPGDASSISLSGVSRPAGLRQMTARYSGFSLVQASTSAVASIVVQ